MSDGPIMIECDGLTQQNSPCRTGLGNACVMVDEKGGPNRAIESLPARGRRSRAWLRAHARRRVFLRPLRFQLLAAACGPISRPRIMKSIRRVQLSKCRYVVSARRCSKKVRRAPTVVRMSW